MVLNCGGVDGADGLGGVGGVGVGGGGVEVVCVILNASACVNVEPQKLHLKFCVSALNIRLLPQFGHFSTVVSICILFLVISQFLYN